MKTWKSGPVGAGAFKPTGAAGARETVGTLNGKPS
jgi:hypothetical protein